jgi:hypothetical protein
MDVAARAEAAGFPTVAHVLRAWARETPRELAETLEAFASGRAIAALRDPNRATEEHHRRVADALRRAATLIRSEAA